MPNRAIPLVEEILAAASDVDAVTEQIIRNHESWRPHWEGCFPGQFVPMLYKWLEDGEWKQRVGRPVCRETSWEREDRKADEAALADRREIDRLTAETQRQADDRERWRQQAEPVTQEEEEERARLFAESCRRARQKEQERRHEFYQATFGCITRKPVGSATAATGVSGAVGDAAVDDQAPAAACG